MTREFFNVIPWGKHKINAGDENKRLLIKYDAVIFIQI
jgi:hypothetical protein